MMITKTGTYLLAAIFHPPFLTPIGALVLSRIISKKNQSICLTKQIWAVSQEHRESTLIEENICFTNWLSFVHESSDSFLWLNTITAHRMGGLSLKNDLNRGLFTQRHSMASEYLEYRAQVVWKYFYGAVRFWKRYSTQKWKLSIFVSPTIQT